MVARVLVVDEHPLLRLLLRTVLENHGHEVREAEHGDEAMVEVADWKPEVVVTDLAVSMSNGEDLVRVLRAKSGDATPRIIATGDHIPADIDVDATFTKPYSAQAVADLVDAMVA
jgi:CheY-like chemotaxis protein